MECGDGPEPSPGSSALSVLVISSSDSHQHWWAQKTLILMGSLRLEESELPKLTELPVSCGLPTQTELFPSRPSPLTDHSLPGTGSHVSCLSMGTYSVPSRALLPTPLFFFNIDFFYICCMWESEDKLQERVLFHCVGLRNGTQVLRLSSKCLYPLSH